MAPVLLLLGCLVPAEGVAGGVRLAVAGFCCFSAVALLLFLFASVEVEAAGSAPPFAVRPFTVLVGTPRPEIAPAFSADAAWAIDGAAGARGEAAGELALLVLGRPSCCCCVVDWAVVLGCADAAVATPTPRRGDTAGDFRSACSGCGAVTLCAWSGA